MEEELNRLLEANHFSSGLRKAVAKLNVTSVDELTALQDMQIAEAELQPAIKTALRVMIDKLRKGEYPTTKKIPDAPKVVFKTPPVGFMIEYLKARGYKIYKEC